MSDVSAALAAGIGYLVGSIPFAFLLARRRGIDLRCVGSGNIGASNVLRSSGVPDAALAVSLDAGKGVLAVLLAQRLALGSTEQVAAGLASIVGHLYPVWLGFRGGKGVATAAGVFALLAPVALAVAGGVFLAAVWMTRYISVGSIAGAVTLPFAAAITSDTLPVVLAASLTAAAVVHRHRPNLARLLAGTERRVGQRL